MMSRLIQPSSRYLLIQLVKRDVLLRYRGAVFGIAWIFLNPLIMLTIFAYVFGAVFQTRWPQQEGGAPFWLVLYSGLIAFNIFAETISRAPIAVRSYPSYVKKVIFPVEILPFVPLGAALVHGAFNYLILLAALTWTGHLTISVILFPLMLVPLIILALGFSWFLAAWGVFIKDMSQIVPPMVQMLMFLSPVLYPASAVPKIFEPIYYNNPIAIIVESCRDVSFGKSIIWQNWIYAFVVSILIGIFGYYFFRRNREEFADAL
ncbi:ABC transporter permease [Dechloromonas hortensis]|uniref:ABC transporter permease n=1 Tax=Dechloromonas hortensis TaxID=337779 RepID=UPI001290CBDE|nr:ABC transporter permease [Dechloromonas hortensis]